MRRSIPIRLLFHFLLPAAVGALIGAIIAHNTDWIPAWQKKVRSYPLPHQVPKYPGGVSLRFAMVHDVLHERFHRHGEAYYRKRNQLVRQAIAEMERTQPTDKRSPEYFALFDDLGAGLDDLKEYEEGVAVLRDKLRQQQSQGLHGLDLYTTYANLGTLLIHGNFRQAVAKNKEARERVSEGLALIRQSIEVNPQAHFGREVWQANTVEFQLAGIDRPLVLLEYDMVGNRLDQSIVPPFGDSIARERVRTKGQWQQASGMFLPESELSSPYRDFQRLWITPVGAEDGWEQAVPGANRTPVPFDEPVLGIVGMWRLGSGANPHFALALGEIMIRVGQRYLSWCAFERAVLLADKFGTSKENQEKLIGHCRMRQAAIERSVSDDERSRLRPRFQAELAFGRRYQQEYQTYEEKRIQEGARLDDPHFYDAFFKGRDRIATSTGLADRLIVGPEERRGTNPPVMVLFAGLFAFTWTCLMRWRSGRISRQTESAGPQAGTTAT